MNISVLNLQFNVHLELILLNNIFLRHTTTETLIKHYVYSSASIPYKNYISTSFYEIYSWIVTSGMVRRNKQDTHCCLQLLLVQYTTS